MKKFLALAPLLMAGVAASSSSASIVLGINGDAQLGSNYIDFGQFPNGAPYVPAPGYGSFEVSLVNASDLATAGVTTGEFGNIQSLNEGTGAVSLPGAFMTFDTGGSNLELIANNIPAGSVGPYVLTNTPDGAIVSFNVDGTVLNTSTGKYIDNFTSTFSATLDGETSQQAVSSLPIDTPFSATFNLTPIAVPEPASLGLLGAGVLSAGMRRRRKA
jgi:hypothetical protein